MCAGFDERGRSCQEATTPKIPKGPFTRGYIKGQRDLARHLEFVLDGMWKVFKEFESKQLLTKLYIEMVNPYVDLDWSD